MLRVPQLPTNSGQRAVYNFHRNHLNSPKFRGARQAPLPIARGATSECPLFVFVAAIRIRHQKLWPLDFARHGVFDNQLDSAFASGACPFARSRSPTASSCIAATSSRTITRRRYATLCRSTGISHFHFSICLRWLGRFPEFSPSEFPP